MPPPPRRSVPGTVIALLLAVAVLVGLGIGHGVWTGNHSSALFVPGGGNGGGSDPFAGPGSGGSGNGNAGGAAAPLSGVEATVAGELVDINVTLSYQNEEAEGTGIVLDAKGLVLTNNHVISGSTSISVVDIGNGRTYGATVVGYDRSHDVALIQLQGASGLKTATIANSSSVSVGEAVVGLGNAGGVGGTPSAAPGHVIALDQSISAQDESTNSTEQLGGLIETDCNIQPGDSGGPLVNSSGAVVGMDTAASVGFSFQTQGSEGYAIPINQAMQVVHEIQSGQSNGSVHVGPTAFLGVEVQAANGTSGALVTGLIQGGAAQAAGLAVDDVITGFGGANVSSPDDLTRLISQDHPGQKVQIAWTDPSGNAHEATVTLASGPPQ